jgi:hypothetical protein
MKFIKNNILNILNIFLIINFSYSLTKSNKESSTKNSFNEINKLENLRTEISRKDNFEESEEAPLFKSFIEGISITKNQPLIPFSNSIKANNIVNTNSPFQSIVRQKISNKYSNKFSNQYLNQYSKPYYYPNSFFNKINPISNFENFNLNNLNNNKEFLFNNNNNNNFDLIKEEKENSLNYQNNIEKNLSKKIQNPLNKNQDNEKDKDNDKDKDNHNDKDNYKYNYNDDGYLYIDLDLDQEKKEKIKEKNINKNLIAQINKIIKKINPKNESIKKKINLSNLIKWAKANKIQINNKDLNFSLNNFNKAKTNKKLNKNSLIFKIPLDLIILPNNPSVKNECEKIKKIPEFKSKVKEEINLICLAVALSKLKSNKNNNKKFKEYLSYLYDNVNFSNFPIFYKKMELNLNFIKGTYLENLIKVKKKPL